MLQLTHIDSILKQYAFIFKCCFSDKNRLDISAIPKIFLEPNFNLNNLETFNAVFPHLAKSSTNDLPVSSVKESKAISVADQSQSNNSAKLLQEKVSVDYTFYVGLQELQ